MSGLEHLHALTDPSTAMEAVELAHDVRVIAGPLSSTEEVVATAVRTIPGGAKVGRETAARPQCAPTLARLRGR